MASKETYPNNRPLHVTLKPLLISHRSKSIITMVLQIEAILNADTFFPGDNLYCRITFTSKKKEDVGSLKISPRNIQPQTPTKQTTAVETLEALSIYVAGYYAVEPTWIKLGPKTKNELAVSVEMDPQKAVGKIIMM
jgi:hypothetical protein